jgi:predicted outer membrane protein
MYLRHWHPRAQSAGRKQLDEITSTREYRYPNRGSGSGRPRQRFRPPGAKQTKDLPACVAITSCVPKALGKLASEKAASDDVKSYDKKLISDHSKANEELKSIAGRKNMALPSDMSSSQRKTEERLEKLSGASFDREYMKGMVKDHEDTVKLFEKEAKSGKDADLKAFAEKTLPTLKDHLTHARQIAKSRTRPANRRREQGVDA